jgi:hypothetical protein
MDPKIVEKLEGRIEEAIAEVIVKMGLKGCSRADATDYAAIEASSWTVHA